MRNCILNGKPWKEPKRTKRNMEKAFFTTVNV